MARWNLAKLGFITINYPCYMQYNIIHDKKQSVLEKKPIDRLQVLFEIRIIINDH
jgi:hypothetical protein